MSKETHRTSTVTVDETVGNCSEHLTTNHKNDLTLQPIPRDNESNLIFLEQCQTKITQKCKHHTQITKAVLVVVLLAGFTVYIGFAIDRSEGDWDLLAVLTVIGAILGLYELLKRRLSRRVKCHWMNSLARWLAQVWCKLQWIFLPAVLLILVLYLTLVVVKTSTQVLAIFGYCVFTLIALLTSKHLTQIRWRPVVGGLMLHVLLAILFLRTQAFYTLAHWLGTKVRHLLRHSLRGGTTAFGNPTAFLHPLLMVVTPVIIYMSALSALFSYIGLTPYLARKISWFLRHILAISHIESVSMAEGLLASMMDYSTDYKPYIPYLTPSEMLTTLVAAHSNLSGYMYGLFSIFWVNPQDMVLSAIIAAPAGIALAKLNQPETYQTRYKTLEQTQYDRRGKKNVFEALSLGAWYGGKVIAAIVIQLIAFLAMYELFDMALVYLGQMVQVTFNFKVLFSYLFCPLGYLVGLPAGEVHDGSYIVGLSMVQNEVIAYLEAGKYRMKDALTKRSMCIVTTAISGFSSFTAMSLVMGAWSKAGPAVYRRAIQALYRAYLITKLASLMTACLVGVFYDEELISEFDGSLSMSDGWLTVGRILSYIPTYKVVLSWFGM